jgi:hypothetical protein
VEASVSARFSANMNGDKMRWFLFILGSLATFRLSHLFTKERGPFAVFERLRNAMPGGRGSAKEWLSCIFCFSLSASALVCSILWLGGTNLSSEEWILTWLGFSAVTLIINQALMFQK